MVSLRSSLIEAPRPLRRPSPLGSEFITASPFRLAPMLNQPWSGFLQSLY